MVEILGCRKVCLSFGQQPGGRGRYEVLERRLGFIDDAKRYVLDRSVLKASWGHGSIFPDVQ
jgi:hypothetical protein